MYTIVRCIGDITDELWFNVSEPFYDRYSAMEFCIYLHGRYPDEAFIVVTIH